MKTMSVRRSSRFFRHDKPELEEVIGSFIQEVTLEVKDFAEAEGDIQQEQPGLSSGSQNEMTSSRSVKRRRSSIVCILSLVENLDSV